MMQTTWLGAPHLSLLRTAQTKLLRTYRKTKLRTKLRTNTRPSPIRFRQIFRLWATQTSEPAAIQLIHHQRTESLSLKAARISHPEMIRGIQLEMTQGLQPKMIREAQPITVQHSPELESVGLETIRSLAVKQMTVFQVEMVLIQFSVKPVRILSMAVQGMIKSTVYGAEHIMKLLMRRTLMTQIC